MKKNIKIHLAIYFLLGAGIVHANEFDNYYKAYEAHQKILHSLQQDIQLYRLKSDVQNLKTKLQKDKLECQKFGGCQSKTLYSPLQGNNEKNKSNKAQRDKELQAVLNKPLPRVTSITNNTVSFDNSPRQYIVGNVVYGVWLIDAITATAVQLKNKDNNITNTVYFYWD